MPRPRTMADTRPALPRPQTVDEIREHLVRDHGDDPKYMKYLSRKATPEAHEAYHRRRSDFAVWLPESPAMNEPYDHSPHHHEPLRAKS